MKPEQIARKDFPTSRRGYEKAAVDAHLREVADAYSQRERGAGSTSLADTAGAKVAGILEAAEAKAREIEADARRQADDLLSSARAEAQKQVERAQASVSNLVGQADELRERVSAMAREVGAPGSLRGETPGPQPVPEPGPQPVPEPAPPEPEIDPSPVTVPEPEPPPPAAGNGADEAAARLVAMKMALEGSSRDEVQRHLAEKYDLANSATLLDEVFARVRG